MKRAVDDGGWGSVVRARVSRFLEALTAPVFAMVGSGGGDGGTMEAPTVTPPQPETAKYGLTIIEGKVIELDRKCRLDKTKSESVRWKNEDDEGCSIVFANEGWPFKEPPEIICIAAKKSSDVFHVTPKALKGTYSYSVYKFGVSNGGLPVGAQTDPWGGPPDPPTMDVFP